MKMIFYETYIQFGMYTQCSTHCPSGKSERVGSIGCSKCSQYKGSGKSGVNKYILCDQENFCSSLFSNIKAGKGKFVKQKEPVNV